MPLRILLSGLVTILTSSLLKNSRQISYYIALKEDGQFLNAITNKYTSDPTEVDGIKLTDSRGVQSENTFHILNDILLKKDSQGIIEIINDADYKEVICICLTKNIYTCCQTLFIREDDILKALKNISKI